MLLPRGCSRVSLDHMYIIFLAAYSGADEPGQLHLQWQQPFQTQTAKVFGGLNFSADELIYRLHKN